MQTKKPMTANERKRQERARRKELGQKQIWVCPQLLKAVAKFQELDAMDLDKFKEVNALYESGNLGADYRSALDSCAEIRREADLQARTVVALLTSSFGVTKI